MYFFQQYFVFYLVYIEYIFFNIIYINCSVKTQPIPLCAFSKVHRRDSIVMVKARW